ncbi:MAG: HAMP domain-containing sensor histidine kinase [Synechococcales bacterium]|nr:HAMP domain-containing sensor histidine kinase [Synechococcales bacterium]
MSMNWLAGLGLMVGFAAGWGAKRWRLGHRRSAADISRPAHPQSASFPDVDADQDLLQRTQLAYQLAHEMAQFQAGFLARTSHELRSPLNGVISLHQLILADLCDDPAEEREFVRQAHDAAKKLLALLDETTSVSKLEHGTAQLSWEALSLTGILNEVKTLTHLQARNRNLRLEISLPDPSLCVRSDRRWLRQVLVNLIITPVYLMEEGTIRLTVQADAEAQQAHILVADQRPASAWQEAVDLLSADPGEKPAAHQSPLGQVPPSEAIAPPPDLNPWDPHSLSSMRLILTQTLVQQLGGRLTLEAVPSEAPSISTGGEEDGLWTRLRCSLPLAIAEVAAD